MHVIRSTIAVADRAVGHEVRVLAREVEEVDRVDERCADADLLAFLAKHLEDRRVMVGKAPCTVGLCEELEGVSADLDGAVDGAFDTAPAMSADQHLAA